jgi:queuine tRNA-ribosyltransferase
MRSALPLRAWRLRSAAMSSEAKAPEDKHKAEEDATSAAALAAKVAKREKKRKQKNQDPLEAPPPPSDFPPWAYDKRDYFGYELVYKSKKSNARVGRIHTPHGIVNTPGFVSVATNGALKAVDHLAAGRNMYMKM